MIVIHCEPRIAWQGPAAEKFYRGLRALDIDCEITHSRHRLGGDVTPVLLGTTCWRDVEASGDYLLVDRCSFGHGADAVTLVWNGHGRRGDHRVPEDYDASRWEAHGISLSPWQRGDKVVLCGQTEPYSPRWSAMEDWYRSVHLATHFRPHPAGCENPLKLPVWQYWDGVGRMITLNSSVAVEAVIRGIPTEVHDEGGMAHPGFRYGDDREPWLHWLAWTQWSWDEIEAGEPIEHLFDG